MRITIWNEYRHELSDEDVKAVYPEGIHRVIQSFLEENEEMTVGTATLDEVEHGLTDEVLKATDVLIWWGHMAHDEVRDDIVEKVYNQVMCGMGLIVLHSGHFSKIFRKLMGTTCSLKWRAVGENERLWVVEPNHPIAKGLPEHIEIPKEEMYGERFDIPAPDELVMLGWYKGGEVFRSGCCYQRGLGKVFYFQPGHETYPIYYQQEIQQILSNAVRWANPNMKVDKINCPNVAPLEKL